MSLVPDTKPCTANTLSPNYVAERERSAVSPPYPFPTDGMTADDRQSRQRRHVRPYPFPQPPHFWHDKYIVRPKENATQTVLGRQFSQKGNEIHRNSRFSPFPCATSLTTRLRVLPPSGNTLSVFPCTLLVRYTLQSNTNESVATLVHRTQALRAHRSSTAPRFRTANQSVTSLVLDTPSLTPSDNRPARCPQ